jgi:hypothetical protein
LIAICGRSSSRRPPAHGLLGSDQDEALIAACLKVIPQLAHDPCFEVFRERAASTATTSLPVAPRHLQWPAELGWNSPLNFDADHVALSVSAQKADSDTVRVVAHQVPVSEGYPGGSGIETRLREPSDISRATTDSGAVVPFSLHTLQRDAENVGANLLAYINAFSENVRDIFANFTMEQT